jgi:hypothetical protein
MEKSSEKNNLPPRLNEFYDVMNDIRNMRVLTETQRTFVSQLSPAQLLEIIDVYNLIMQNINDFFS